jgi:hypothetical protein
MKANLKGSLENINKCWRWFEHNGKSMSKQEVRTVLEYGIQKGYETTDDFKEGEIDNLLNDA